MAELATRPAPTADDHPAAAGPSAGPRRGRWPLAATVVVVVALVIGWVAAPGALTRVGPVTLAFAEDAPATVVEGFEGPAGTYVVGYEHEAYLDVAVSVPSAGPVAVEVVDVRPRLQAAPLLVPAEGWEPTALPAGGTASGAWRLRFDNCEGYHEREAMLVEHVEVEARVLGRRVVEQVALDRPMMVRSPMLWQCPDRTLDRRDDVRGGGAAFRRDVP